MRRAFLFSDSHGDRARLQAMLRRAWRDGLPVDLYVHLGDGSEDFAALEPMIYDRDPRSLRIRILGNCDFGCYDAAEWTAQPFGAHRLYMAHGHRHGVKLDIYRIYFAGVDHQADLVLYGHTHVADIREKDGILLINPGSAGFEHTMAILHLEEDRRDADLLTF